MKILRFGCLLWLVGCSTFASAQGLKYPPFTKWYQNPLGFEPINLHTSSAIILPAGAALIGLLLTKKDTTLRNRFSVFAEGGSSWGYFPPYTTMHQTNVGVVFQARRWLSMGAEANLYLPRDSFNHTWGVGLRPFFRFYPINRPGFRLYFDAGAGLILFAEPFPQPTTGYGVFSEPRTGTRLNGSPRYGLGAEVNLTARTALMVGARHVHVSNGNHPSQERNPGHDSNGFYVGLSYGLMRP
ncbi:acyloxyacyl hydrolase [Larkinella sp. VNQ87]|uniref:acyloxyacyl hydrolase n=1 Tax=Larkinella sp. VNQ87 TaxID=3400921 RepID=UPI003C09EC8F